MRTPIEALKEIRDRLTYFCLRTDGKYDPPWATELVGIIDETVTDSHAIGNAARKRELLSKNAEYDNNGNVVVNGGKQGNAAAMREVLVRVRGWLERMNKERLDAFAESQITPAYAVNRQAKTIIEDNEYHIGQINAALAAPPRNCDMMPDIDNLTMHDLAKSPCKSTLAYASREELLALVRWLLAPAAQEGGAAQ